MEDNEDVEMMVEDRDNEEALIEVKEAENAEVPHGGESDAEDEERTNRLEESIRTAVKAGENVEGVSRSQSPSPPFEAEFRTFSYVNGGEGPSDMLIRRCPACFGNGTPKFTHTK